VSWLGYILLRLVSIAQTHQDSWGDIHPQVTVIDGKITWVRHRWPKDVSLTLLENFLMGPGRNRDDGQGRSTRPRRWPVEILFARTQFHRRPCDAHHWSDCLYLLFPSGAERRLRGW